MEINTRTKVFLKDLKVNWNKHFLNYSNFRIESLENSLKQKNNELVEEKKKFLQLKNDFKYNLKLLEERDAELEKFEQSIIGNLSLLI